jgi:hypothetical protein
MQPFFGGFLEQAFAVLGEANESHAGVVARLD